MAQRAPSLRSCGCITPTGVRCHHAAARDKLRPTARQRGYDDEWRAAAATYLTTHRRCTCGAPAVLVRHIISIRRRPDLRMDPSNWLPGCRSCNAKDAHRDRQTGGHGQCSQPKGTYRLGPRLGTQPIFSSRDGGQKS